MKFYNTYSHKNSISGFSYKENSNESRYTPQSNEDDSKKGSSSSSTRLELHSNLTVNYPEDYLPYATTARRKKYSFNPIKSEKQNSKNMIDKHLTNQNNIELIKDKISSTIPYFSWEDLGNRRDSNRNEFLNRESPIRDNYTKPLITNSNNISANYQSFHADRLIEEEVEIFENDQTVLPDQDANLEEEIINSDEILSGYTRNNTLQSNNYLQNTAIGHRILMLNSDRSTATLASLQRLDSENCNNLNDIQGGITNQGFIGLHSCYGYPKCENINCGNCGKSRLTTNISDTSNLSWFSINNQSKEYFSFGCCAILTICIFILLAIISVVGISIHLGFLTNQNKLNVLPLSGHLKIKTGDAFNDQLFNSSSKEFQIKTTKYEAILKSAMQAGSIEDSIVNTEVYAFRAGSLIVFFRIYLDKKKLFNNYETRLLPNVNHKLIGLDSLENKKNNEKEEDWLVKLVNNRLKYGINQLNLIGSESLNFELNSILVSLNYTDSLLNSREDNFVNEKLLGDRILGSRSDIDSDRHLNSIENKNQFVIINKKNPLLKNVGISLNEQKENKALLKNKNSEIYNYSTKHNLNSEKAITTSTSTTTMIPLKTTKPDIVEIFTNTPAYTTSNIRQSITIRPIIQRFNASNLSNANSLYEKHNYSSANINLSKNQNNFDKTSLTPNNFSLNGNLKNTSSLHVSSIEHEKKLPSSTFNTIKKVEVITTPKTILLNSTKSWFMYKTRKTTLSFLEDLKPFSTSKKNNLFNDKEKNDWTTFEPNYTSSNVTTITQKPDSLNSKATTIESILSSFLRLRHQKSSFNKTKSEKNLVSSDQAAESSSNFINLHEVMIGGFSPSPIIPGQINNTSFNKEKYLANNLAIKNIQNSPSNSFIPPNHKPLPTTSVHFSSMDFGQWRPVSPLKQKSDLFSMFKADNTSKNRSTSLEKLNSNVVFNLTTSESDLSLNNTSKLKNKKNNFQVNSEILDTTTTSSIYGLTIKPKQGLRPLNPSLPSKAYTAPSMLRQHVHKLPTSINKNSFNQNLNLNRNLMPSSSNTLSNNRKPINNLLMNNDNLQFGLRPNLQKNNNLNKNNWLLNNPKADRHVPLFGQPLTDTSLESIDPIFNFNNPLANFEEMSSFLRREDNDNTETTLPPANFHRESRTNFKKDFDKEYDFEKLFKLNDDFESLKLNKTNINNKVGSAGNNFSPTKSTSVPLINRFQKRIGIVNREFMDDQYFKAVPTPKEPLKNQNLPVHQTNFNTIYLNKNNEIQTNTIEKINNIKVVEKIKNDLIRIEKNDSFRLNDKFITNPNKKTTTTLAINEDLRLNNYNDDIDLTGELPKFNSDGIIETTTEIKNFNFDRNNSKKLSTFPSHYLTTTETSIKLDNIKIKNESLKIQCDSSKEFPCADGFQCIEKSKKCNYKIDCNDRSDELSCTCSDYLSKLNPRKICDSVLDCADYSDEINCDYCRLGNSNSEKNVELNPENIFICSNAKSCITKDKICDGVFDCPNGADEEFCVSLADENDLMKNSLNLDLHRSTTKTYQKEGALVIRKNGLWAPLCLENSDVFSSSFSTETTAELRASEFLNEAKISNNNLKGFNEDVLQSENGDLLVANSNIATNSAVFSTPSYQDINRPTSRLDNVKNSKHMSKKTFEKEASFNWQLDELGRAVCSIQSFNELESVNVTSLKEINSNFSAKTSGIKYFSMDQPNILFRNNAKWGNLFKADVCSSGKIAKIRCKDFECGVRPSASNVRRRIIGGQSSRPASWPWQVALYREGEFQCGGVLIGHKWILSAAHCFHSSRTSYWTARLGILRRGNNFENPFEQILRITHIIIHPGYVDKGFLNDIVLLKLEKSVKYSDYVRPLCLPDANEDINLYHGKLCSIVGWGKLFEAGRIFPDTLQELKLPVISTSECRRRTMFLPLYKITDGMFCAGGRGRGRDACLGDSGGPLMCPTSNGKWSLLGITSNGDGCGRPGRPGVYTKVSSYVAWIEEEMSKPRSLIQIDNELLENYYNKDIISELNIDSSNNTKNKLDQDNLNSDLILSYEEKKVLMDQNIRNFDKNSRTDTSNLRISSPFKNINESTSRRVAKLLKERKLPSFIEEGEVISICSGWRCPLGKCLNMTQICDGHIECLDASDESNC